MKRRKQPNLVFNFFPTLKYKNAIFCRLQTLATLTNLQTFVDENLIRVRKRLLCDRIELFVARRKARAEAAKRKRSAHEHRIAD